VVQITSIKRKVIDGVGERIKRYRVSMRLSQQRLAQMMEVNRSYLAQIERSDKEPSYHFLKQLLETTGLSSKWVLYGTGTMYDDAQSPEDGERREIESLAGAGLERLNSGLYVLGDKVYVPLSSVTACCGAGFDVFDDYSIGDAIAVNRNAVGTLRGDMPPFAVMTEGNSMTGYGIKEGSTVVVNPAEDVYSGCVALVIFGDKASVKKVYDTSDGKDLIASNGQKIHVTHEELEEDQGARVLGRVMVSISPPDDGV
jgi:transcriptional regulator with XRE-family HTH domain